MFSLMDRVERGIDDMLRYLEEHIKNQGLADMIASANIITTVCCCSYSIFMMRLKLLVSLVLKFLSLGFYVSS